MLFKRKSKIHRTGIFTDSPIKAGEKFYIIPMGKVSKTPKHRWSRLGDVWVDDDVVLNYINHSCSPNCRLDIASYSIISLRDVEPDEEIACDYNLTEINGTKVSCNCQSKSCRGYFIREE